jgi:hypothetical protein
MMQVLSMHLSTSVAVTQPYIEHVWQKVARKNSKQCLSYLVSKDLAA